MNSTWSQIRVASSRRFAGQAYRRGKIGRPVLKSFADGTFPFTYFVQNVMMLRKEAGWKRLSPRLQRNLIRRMLRERTSIFAEVTRKLAEVGNGWMDAPADADEGPEGAAASEDISYCIHCGGCCEIASGLGEFPPESEMPPRWRRLFSEGLGRGHRFCPFLREERATGRSLCPVHPWRSYPCRVFERDECEFFLRDPDYLELSDPDNLVVAWHRLARLINGR